LFTRILQRREHILCIDELEMVRHRERVLQHIGALCDIAFADDSPLTLVVAAQESPTTILHHIAQSHKPAQCRIFAVEPFSREVTDAFVQHRLETTQTVFSDNELTLIFEQSGGIPLLVQQIAADLYRGFSLLKKEP
jgi:type II secretory pathway predicted ATPase ExeA